MNYIVRFLIQAEFVPWIKGWLSWT